MNPETPTYNLKAVVQETGIKPDTLRAWERRYGMPEPERSAGGHRLYSQRDIDTLQWLMRRQGEGLTISRAVDLWRSIEEEGRDPLIAPEFTPRVEEPQALHLAGSEVETIRQQWLAACLRFDEKNAEQILAQAFAIYRPETVCLEILRRGLHEVGEAWHKGTVTVQQEHFITALAARRIEALLSASPPPTRPGRILMACPPQEEHTFGQVLIQLLLRRQGYETIYLGANVPLERMEAALAQVRPTLVLLSAQQLSTGANLLEMAEQIAKRQMPVAYGGRIFNLAESMRARIPGYFLGEELESVPARVSELFPIPPPLPDPEPLPARFRTALSYFQAKLPEILADVPADAQKISAQKISIQPAHMAQANLSLSLNIHAALKFGDVSLLGVDADWIVGLLINLKVPTNHLDTYISAYLSAVQTHMQEHAGPIVEMLEMFRSRVQVSVGQAARRKAQAPQKAGQP